jgi:hypothetical protein
MKKLITSAGEFGPFSAIETLDDRYSADGQEFPFSVVVTGEIVDVEPEVTPAPIIVPTTITRRQARQKLLLIGLLDDVEPAINAIPDATQRALAMIEWQDSQAFERHRPLVISIGAALGLDSVDLDTLFIEASAL